MKIEYVDKEKTIYGDQPIRFRMVLQKYKDTFIISREIFNCGFTDGERDDVIFCPDLRSRYDTKISYMSIMTQRITDKEYLDTFEDLLLSAYQEECEKLVSIIEKELQRTIILENDKINEFNKSISFLSSLKRVEKINKIKLCIANK